MKVVALDEISADLDLQFAGLPWSDGDFPRDRSYSRSLVRHGFPMSDYQALVAVEDGQLLGRIETFILPYRTPRGTEAVAGLAGAVARPDSLGRGVASALLEEAHSRERSAGRRWSFLWTHRSWGAHRLYERLGYRDVYSPPTAVRKLARPAPPLPPGYAGRIAHASDAALFQQIFDKATRSRLGFLPRFPGSFRARLRLGWRKASEYVVLLRDSVPVGYAVTAKSPEGLCAVEVLVLHSRDAQPMLALLERKAGRGWLAFGRTTFITDNEELLRRRGYLIAHQAHRTLMAKPLVATARRPRSADPKSVCESPRYSSHADDVF